MKSQSWTVPDDGIVVSTGGHLHMGGIDITLKDETNNAVICKGVAVYHTDPDHLASINGCQTHWAVSKGNTVSVTARYDNSQPWEDVMGIQMTWVWWGHQ